MGRKTKYERAGAKLAEEVEEGLKLCVTLREDIQNQLSSGDGFPVAQAKSYLQMLQNTVKTKMAYDQSNKAFADSLTPAQQQDVVVTWIAQMTKDTRTRFLNKLTAALETGELPEIQPDEAE
jgi:hypothetical protein